MARKSGQIIQKGDRKFTVRVYMGTDGNGKRKYLNHTVKGTKKDAQAVLNKFLRDKDLGVLIEPSSQTLNDYLDYWLEVSVKPKTREKTYCEYKGSLNRYIKPVLGNEKLGKVNTLSIQKIYTDMSERGLAFSTISYVHVVLREALKQAVNWQMLSRNVADYVNLPKRSGNYKACPMSQEEVSKFRVAAKSSKWYILFELLLGTGLRPSEALGLTWRNVNLDKGVLMVTQKLSRQSKYKWSLDDPKSAKSRRSVTLPASLVTFLTQHKHKQGELGVDNPHNLVFPSIDGEPVDGNCVSQQVFKPLIKKAGLSKSIRLYDLRHTHATLALMAGIHPKIVSERLGHSSIKITLDTYSHVLQNIQEESTQKLESVLYEQPNVLI